jgi:hypothetical protein
MAEITFIEAGGAQHRVRGEVTSDLDGVVIRLPSSQL